MEGEVCIGNSNNNNPARIQFIAFKVVGCTVRNPNTDEEEKGVGERGRVGEKGGERESNVLKPAFLSFPILSSSVFIVIAIVMLH